MAANAKDCGMNEVAGGGQKIKGGGVDMACVGMFT